MFVSSRCVLALFLACASSGFLPRPARAAEMLKNPGFENPYGAGGTADGWLNNSWGPCEVSFSADTAGAHGGQAAQKVACRSFHGGAVQLRQTGVEVDKAKTYYARVWLRAEGIAGPVTLMLRKEGAPYTAYLSRSFEVSGRWKEYTLIGRPAATDPNANFFVLFSGLGTLWVDDATLQVADEMESANPAAKGNLLPRSSFEGGLARGWRPFYRETGGYWNIPALEPLDLRPEADATTAVDGRASLKVVLPPDAQFHLTSPFVRVNYGRTHTFTVFLKADHPLRAGLSLLGGAPPTPAGSLGVDVGTDWKRYTLSARLPISLDEKYAVRVSCAARGTLWIDAAQLEEGPATPYRRGESLELYVQADAPGHLWLAGEPVRVGVSLHGSAPSAALSWRLHDYAGRVQSEGSRPVALKNGVASETLVLKPRGLGMFRLLVSAAAPGEPAATSEFAIAVAPPPARSGESAFGHHLQLNDRWLSIGEHTGVQWTRLHDVSHIARWVAAEPESGQFRYFDAVAAKAKQHGIHILGVLGLPPAWASSAPAGTNWYDAEFFAPRYVEEWTRYVEAMVGHYRGTIDCWEIWNEPDGGFWRSKQEEYLPFLKAAYAAAKRANPQCTVVLGGPCHMPPTDWLKKIFAGGGYDCCDAVGVHFYLPGFPDEAGTPLGRYVDEMRALMAQYGKLKPIWHTEAGLVAGGSFYQDATEPGSDPDNADLAADWMPRAYVTNLAAGVARFFYYSYVDQAEWDGAVKPCAVTYAVAASLLAGEAYAGEAKLPEPAVAHLFRRGGDSLAVLWGLRMGTARRTARVALPAGVSLRDKMGNPVGQPSGGSTSFGLSRAPIYLVGKGVSVERLKAALAAMEVR